MSHLTADIRHPLCGLDHTLYCIDVRRGLPYSCLVSAVWYLMSEACCCATPNRVKRQWSACHPTGSRRAWDAAVDLRPPIPSICEPAWRYTVTPLIFLHIAVTRELVRQASSRSWPKPRFRKQVSLGAGITEAPYVGGKQQITSAELNGFRKAETTATHSKVCSYHDKMRPVLRVLFPA